ncbi:MAG: nitroreductase family protein [Candidatus Saccharibacteria bacterium]|nr:nitroreductase family protein [Candidatus Saccharibacteria bacterium]
MLIKLLKSKNADKKQSFTRHKLKSNQRIQIGDMTLLEAASKRHTVRKYSKKPLSSDIVKKLNNRVQQNNQKYGLSIKLVINDATAFSPVIKMFLAKGVKNYFIMAADLPKGVIAEKGEKIIAEKLGYSGADIMLYAQTLGLNTWWVGGVFNRKSTNELMNDKVVIAVVAVGYGKTQGKLHKMRPINEVSKYNTSNQPKWFINGIKTAMFAPTAFGAQQFRIIGEQSKVRIEVHDDKFGAEESGIIKYHFELGAGTDNFEWTSNAYQRLYEAQKDIPV